MKIKVGDTWWVSMGLGMTAYAKTYEEACALERTAIKAMKYGLILGVVMSIVVITLVLLS